MSPPLSSSVVTCLAPCSRAVYPGRSAPLCYPDRVSGADPGRFGTLYHRDRSAQSSAAARPWLQPPTSAVCLFTRIAGRPDRRTTGRLDGERRSSLLLAASPGRSRAKSERVVPAKFCRCHCI